MKNHSFKYCWNCSYNLTLATTVKCDQQHLKQQGNITDLLDKGYHVLGSYGWQYSFVIFEMLSWFCRWILAEKTGLPLRDYLRKILKLSYTLPDKISYRKQLYKLYCLDANLRHQILVSSFYLLQDYPFILLRTMEQCNITASSLLKSIRKAPFALWHPISFALSNPVLPKQENSTRTKYYGQGRFWKLDCISPEIRYQIKRIAATKNMKAGLLVEHILEDYLQQQNIVLEQK